MRKEHLVKDVLGPFGAVGGAWAAVAAVEYFHLPLANLWIFVLAVYAGVYLLAAVVTVWAAIHAWRTLDGPMWSAAVLAVAIAAAAAIQLVDWLPVYVHGNYRLNRAAFAAVAALSADGSLTSDDYYGAPLPWNLKYLAYAGNAATIGAVDDSGRTALFLAVWVGIPDDAIGYVYLGDSPPAQGYDCFGYICQVDRSLGDGWYWVQ
ncbi:hypothetical protein [Catenuloplanes japonicus]|uniref:hypothetical protein n=1 Tax=Catenuloplanes japonicus TaxID=33876 RepID=UPI0012F9222F|nr:hypothetical protein [Catenuloplanes japonicus]